MNKKKQRKRGSVVRFNPSEGTFIPPLHSEIDKYRRYMCHHIQNDRFCNKGAMCKYAHSEAQIRMPGDPVPLNAKAIFNEGIGYIPMPKNEPKKEFKKETKRPPKAEQKFSFDSDEDFPPIKLESEINLGKSNSTKFGTPVKAKNVFHAATPNKMHINEEDDVLHQILVGGEQLKKVSAELKHTRQELHKSKASVLELNEQIDKSDVEKQELKDTIRNQNELIESLTSSQESVKDAESDLEKEVKKLTNENKKLAKEVKFYTDQFFNLSTKIENDTLDSLKEMHVKDNIDHKELYQYLVKRVKMLFECPITFDKITKPSVLPSGVTIDFKTMKKFIKTQQNDPYDRNKICETSITNRFAVDLNEILEEVQKYEQDMKPVQIQTKVEVEMSDKSTGVKPTLSKKEVEVNEVHKKQLAEQDLKYKTMQKNADQQQQEFIELEIKHEGCEYKFETLSCQFDNTRALLEDANYKLAQASKATEIYKGKVSELNKTIEALKKEYAYPAGRNDTEFLTKAEVEEGAEMVKAMYEVRIQSLESHLYQQEKMLHNKKQLELELQVKNQLLEQFKNKVRVQDKKIQELTEATSKK